MQKYPLKSSFCLTAPGDSFILNCQCWSVAVARREAVWVIKMLANPKLAWEDICPMREEHSHHHCAVIQWLSTGQGKCSPPTRVFFWKAVMWSKLWSGPSPYLQLSIAVRVRRWFTETYSLIIDDKLAMRFISDGRDAILQEMWQAKSKHQACPLSVLWKVP